MSKEIVLIVVLMMLEETNVTLAKSYLTQLSLESPNVSYVSTHLRSSILLTSTSIYQLSNLSWRSGFLKDGKKETGVITL